MKKILLLIGIACTLNFTSEAQVAKCATFENFEQELINNPQIKINMDALGKFTEEWIKNQSVNRTSNQVYIIPLVFHILHNYGPENITDAQVIRAVEILNRDYRKMNADTQYAYSGFRSIIADCEIEFRLANIDPQGNCTNGINHIVTPLTYNADNNSKINQWPNRHYLNIWVANTLANTGAAAYAQLPGSPNSTDGIMCWYKYVGDNGTSQPSHARTLTHEIGHHLNLLHPWGHTNSPGVACGTDSVADTPPTKGWSFCPDSTQASVCNTSVVENYQNYMDYSYCDIMFTEGQKARMHACLNSNISMRDSLWTPQNLARTGTDGSPIVLCAPKADFKIDNSFTCVNTPVLFYDQSWKGKVTSWQWSFPGGTPSTSTDSLPSVVWTTPGIYNASLTVSNASGADSITKTALVRVSGPAQDSVPFTESFEDTSSFPGLDGWIDNLSGGTTWARVTNVGNTGTSSLKMNNYQNNDGAIDEWITRSLDFSNVDFPVTISFYVANQQRNGSTDRLNLFWSTDCGKSWTGSSYMKSGAALSTAGNASAGSFTPTAAQWRLENVPANPVRLKPNVRFKFQNVSNHGNNTYIDDINITGNIVGIDETDELQSGFTLYPNPTNGVTTLSYVLAKSGNIKLEVKDILGKTVSVVLNENQPAGVYEFKIPALSEGVYLIDLSVNNKHHIRKLIVS